MQPSWEHSIACGVFLNDDGRCTCKDTASAARRQMYLTLQTMPNGSSCSVGIDMHDALTFDRDEFAEVYLNAVYGAKRGEALAWADEQIEERANTIPGRK